MKTIAIAALLVAGLASPALAGGINILASPHQSGVGGEFTFNAVGGWLDTSQYAGTTKGIGAATSFQTFCLETNEFINIPENGYEATLNTAAVNGGSGGPNPDPVSIGTGWLYSQFAKGTLAGYNYGAGRTTSAGLLQAAIWWLEEESGFAYNASNIFMKAVFDNFGSEVAARANGGQNYGVMALNMTKDGAKKQDALFYVPDGGTTLMLLGGALMGLGALRRRLTA